MQYLTWQLVVSYLTINRFRATVGMEELIRDLFIDPNLRLKMEELVTLDCLFIDETKIEDNSNKYSFVWKKATEKFSPWIGSVLIIWLNIVFLTRNRRKNTKNLIGIWKIGLTMGRLIPTPIQRVGYTSLTTSNTNIPRQVLSKKSGFIRQNNLTWLHKRDSMWMRDISS